MKTKIQFKHAILVIAQWLITTTVLAQTQDWLWAKREGTTNYDYGSSVATDAGGNVYVAGKFANQVLSKYDSIGNVIWSVSASVTPNGVTTDLAGNVYLTGYYDSSATFENITLTSSGMNDLFIVKYNASGHVLWAKSGGGTDEDYCTQAAVDLSGNVFITGYYSSSNFTLGSITLANAGESDFFIARYDSSGNVIWAKKAGGFETEVGHAIAVDASGKVYVSGFFTSGSITFDNIKLKNTGGVETADIFLAKYDASGSVIWAKKAGGTYDDYVGGVTIDPNGNAFITGYYGSTTITFGQFTLSNPDGYNAIYLTKYSSAGTPLWATTAGGAGNYDAALAVVADKDGNPYITGDFTSHTITFGNTTLINSSTSYTQEVFLTKYDATGNVVWAVEAGDIKDDFGASLAMDTKSNIYITGSFYSSSIAFGNITLFNFNAGSSDLFIAKYGINNCNHVFYADADGDGFGIDNIITQGCNPPVGYAYNSGDCNDNNASVNPSANELCGNMIDDNCNGVTDENSIVAFISPMGTVEICKGSIEILTANSSSGVSYQWLKNASDISGATQQTYSATKSGDYTVKESNTLNCSSTSAATTLKVNSVPDAVITPLGNLDICQTGSVVLQANVGDGYTYQWKKGNNIISGATNQDYTATKTGSYKVDVINSSGCGKTSKGVKVTKSCRESLESVINTGDKFSLSPNPASDKFSIDLKLSSELLTANGEENTMAYVEVMNIIGQIIYSEKFVMNDGETKHEISFDPSIPSGLYLVRVKVNDNVYSGQLSYQK